MHKEEKKKIIYLNNKYDIEGVELIEEEELAKTTLEMLDSTSQTILAAVQVEVSSCESIFIKVAEADGKVLSEKEYK